MERIVTIVLKIDPKDYNGGDDSPRGAIDLTIAFLKGEADWPPIDVIRCQDLTVEIGGTI